MKQQSPRHAYVQGVERLSADVRLPTDLEQAANPRPSYHFLTLKEVLRQIPVSRTTWYEGIKKGIYPKGYSLGGRRVGWRSCDIESLKDKLVGEV